MPTVEWMDNWEKAFERAEKSNLSVFVDFYNPE